MNYRITQYYQGGSVCSPSRYTQLTGRWPAEFRIHGHYAKAEQYTQRAMSQFLDPSAATLPKLLKACGYYTAHVGKWHLGLPPQAEKGASRVELYNIPADPAEQNNVAGQHPDIVCV